MLTTPNLAVLTSTWIMKRQPLRKIPIKNSDDTWCRSDSEISLAFADELKKRFQRFHLASREDVKETLAFLNAPSTDSLPIQHVSPEEVCLHIQKLHPRKAKDSMALIAESPRLCLKGESCSLSSCLTQCYVSTTFPLNGSVQWLRWYQSQENRRTLLSLTDR